MPHRWGTSGRSSEAAELGRAKLTGAKGMGDFFEYLEDHIWVRLHLVHSQQQ